MYQKKNNYNQNQITNGIWQAAVLPCVNSKSNEKVKQTTEIHLLHSGKLINVCVVGKKLNSGKI